jgi:hypothetical protein
MDVTRRLRSAAVSACWRQWRALGASLSRAATEPARSVVDVEALILMSLALLPDERRLGDAVAWWAGTASRLVSVQRMRTIARRGPPDADTHVALFAAAACAEGDRRWLRLAAPGSSLPKRAAKGPELPRLRERAALMPRLRAAFGVGAKADVLLFLLTAPRPDASARDLAAALDYTPRAVRDAAEDMTLSGLLDASGERPRRYAVQRQPWADLLLDGDAFPPWKPWSATCEMVTHLIAWSAASDATKASAYLKASTGRDVIEAHSKRLETVHGAPRPPRTTDLAALGEYCDGLASWIEAEARRD